LYVVETIRFKNFGRFVEEQNFSLSDLPKITQVDGHNLNTGGSSASSKTTFLRTLDYNLGINDIPATILQSRLTKDLIYVETKGLWDGAPVTIYRSKGDLRVTGIDPRTNEAFSITGNSELAEEKIDEILGLPRELFKKITHKEQNEGGFFLSLTPKEAYEFMLKTLNLGDWLEKMEKAEKDAAAAKLTLPKKEASVELSKAEYDSAWTAFEASSMHELPTEPSTDEISLLNTDIIQSKYEILEIDKKRPTLMAILDKRKPVQPVQQEETPEMAESRALIKSFEAEINKVDLEKTEKVTRFRSSISTLTAQFADKKRRSADLEKKDAALKGEHETLLKLLKERADVEREIAAHKDSKCSTCSQYWAEAGLSPHAKMLKLKLDSIDKAGIRVPEISANLQIIGPELDALRAELPGLEEKILKANLILNKITDEDAAVTLRTSLKTVREKLHLFQTDFNSQIKVQMDGYTQQMGAYLAKRKLVEDDLAVKRAEWQTRLEDKQAKAAAIEKAVNDYNMKLQRHKDDLESKNKAVELWSTRLKDAKKDLEDAKNELALYEDAKRLIKAFTMTKFEDALIQIGQMATETVNKIPNMATATITFEPFKEVKGKIKDEIVPMIGMDGEEAVPLKSLCGGERSGADNAIDLAVIDLIEERSAVGANYYILDEPCNGQDSICKTEFMEMLKSSTTNKKILIVEHDPIIKQMSEHTVTVERDGAFSRIV